MEFKKIGIIFSILILMFFLVGCENNGKSSNAELGAAFVGGTSNGLDISFMPNSPPDSVMDNGKQIFDVVVQLDNVGEYDINSNDITIKLSGIDPTDFNKQNSAFKAMPKDDFTATKKMPTGDIIPGTVEQISFNDFAYKGEITGSTTFTIMADVCYKYGTKAVSNVCYKENVFSKKGVCSVSGEKTVYNSNGPVQITSIKENPAAENKISFTIEISHVGTGEVYVVGSECDDTDYSSKDKVHLKIETGVNNNFFKCTGWNDGQKEGDVSLIDGKATLVCTQQYDATGDFEKQMSLELTYNYKQTITKQITVQHLG